MKGSLLLVEGRQQTRNWDDDNSQKYYKTEIVAEQIQRGPRPTGQPRDEGPTEIEVPDGEEIDVKDIPL